MNEHNQTIYFWLRLAVDAMNYSLPYKRLFGGVSAMTSTHFKQINGYPNRYWGWGGNKVDN